MRELTLSLWSVHQVTIYQDCCGYDDQQAQCLFIPYHEVYTREKGDGDDDNPYERIVHLK